MIRFIQSPAHISADQERKDEGIKLAVVALVLGLLLFFQVGLVLWVFVKQW